MKYHWIFSTPDMTNISQVVVEVNHKQNMISQRLHRRALRCTVSSRNSPTRGSDTNSKLRKGSAWVENRRKRCPKERTISVRGESWRISVLSLALPCLKARILNKQDIIIFVSRILVCDSALSFVFFFNTLRNACQEKTAMKWKHTYISENVWV